MRLAPLPKTKDEHGRFSYAKSVHDSCLSCRYIDNDGIGLYCKIPPILGIGPAAGLLRCDKWGENEIQETI